MSIKHKRKNLFSKYLLTSLLIASLTLSLSACKGKEVEVDNPLPGETVAGNSGNDVQET